MNKAERTIPTPANPETETSFVNPEVIAEESYTQSRWLRALRDPKVRQGIAPFFRTLINMGVTFADTIPAVGGAASLAADSLKMFGPLIKRFGGPDLDLTPSVSKKVAWGTELVEIKTLGFAPTHAVETFLQLKREDWARLKISYKAFRDILVNEKSSYEHNKTKINAAIEAFDAK